jgi:DDE superfamily endonuclease/Tc5 transposase DNA-binding domain
MILHLGCADFQASDGWFKNFKKRHGISRLSMSGESADADMERADDFLKNTLPGLLENYSPDDIYNADETGLYFKCLPDKTYTFRSEKCHGGKKSKERLTVMVCTNMFGTDKVKLLVIGKSKKPRCFKNVRSLPVDYASNKTAWMTSVIF